MINITALEHAAVPTGATKNNAPFWANGTFVYRVCTTDDPEVLRFMEQGFAITNHLLDGSIRQVPIVNGLIGHDHPGGWNWDGLWPYWNRVTFRARDWETLRGFMQRAGERSNTAVSFHVNLTDVNAGLEDYPESREFFQKLVATKSIYRRDGHQSWPNEYVYPDDPSTDPPYVPKEIPKDAVDCIEIVSLVNYKNFWDSGLAKEMIDGFYDRLPYAPPVLYLDVLTLSGANFNTGFPDGPLGGSEETQLEGVLAIAEYLHSKGTAVGTEGDRPFIGTLGSYGWLHCVPGISADDYSIINGATRFTPLLHVAGNTGCFVVSPIASTAYGLDQVRSHYASLPPGSSRSKPTPGLDTCHVAYPAGTGVKQDIPGVLTKWPDPFKGTEIYATSEFDIPGAGDPFRGDWADLVNNFYLTGIQELYHVGNRSVRSAVFNKHGVLHVAKFSLVDSAGGGTIFAARDCAPANQIETATKDGRIMIEEAVALRVKTQAAGNYRLILHGNIPGDDQGAVNIYVNGGLQQTVTGISFPSRDKWEQEFALGEFALEAGDNIVTLDAGPIYMRWSDGAVALWTMPFLRKGFTVTNGDVIFAADYDRMWPDTWSGQKKIYFFSWDGTDRAWKLPKDWATVKNAVLHPLTPDGRGEGIPLAVRDRSISPKLPPQTPCILTPAAE